MVGELSRDLDRPRYLSWGSMIWGTSVEGNTYPGLHGGEGGGEGKGEGGVRLPDCPGRVRVGGMGGGRITTVGRTGDRTMVSTDPRRGGV